jgi:hypothetical protein
MVKTVGDFKHLNIIIKHMFKTNLIMLQAYQKQCL